MGRYGQMWADMGRCVLGPRTLWSIESGSETSCPSSLCVPMTQRQSPTELTKSSRKCRNARMAQLPLSRALTSMVGSHAISRKWMLHASKASASVPAGSSRSSSPLSSATYTPRVQRCDERTREHTGQFRKEGRRGAPSMCEMVCKHSCDTSWPYLPWPS